VAFGSQALLFGKATLALPTVILATICAILLAIMKLTREQAFVEFSHAQAELEDSGKSLPCRLDPEFFYPEDYYEQATKKVAENIAKQLCASCPLKALCASYAVLAQEDYGIWGGTNPRERREIRLNLRAK
jgi:hypothetical protein